ncbi:type I restriction enzyme HsdR N-terminal domain-containing protein [Rhodohalobacter mucosus]|nr:type I restriction enzyme HsdR N-terminal domain-containing protein [Rhodohalobacter mucosus]
MKSVVTPHFPRIVFEKNEKLLYNPVLKKRFVNRPEERVRLRWVEYILNQTDHLKSRIGFELPVALPQKENQLRADLILYTRDMKPLALIECKAPSVRLSQSVAEQAARYNTAVGAPYICLTNGITDFWFKTDSEKQHSSESPLNEIASPDELNILRDSAWWASRGFLSDESATPLNKRLVEIMNYAMSLDEELDIRYLNFKDSPLPYGLNHYFALLRMDAEYKLAITIMGKEGEDPILAAILNRAGKNEGLLIINLTKCSMQEADSGHLLVAGDESVFPAHNKLPIFTHRFNPSIVDNLPAFLMRFF